MTSGLAWLIIPILGGIAVVLQARFMGTMDETLGTLESVFITYGSGGLLIGLVMLAVRGGNLAGWAEVPWYTLLAGVMGLVIVGAIGYSVPRLGFIATFSIVAVVQYALSALFDHYGWLGSAVRPLDLTKLLGIGLLLLGAWLIVRQ